MSTIRRAVFVLSLLSFFTIGSSAQQQTPPVPVQTPRQALIEVANGGGNALMKHLTVEVQQLLKQPENKETLVELGMTPSIKGAMGQEVQFFESGPVLASVSQPKEHSKIEIQINNDDMSGDQDTMDLAVHSFRDGVEQDEEWQAFLSHVTVTMVRQQNIWRLSKIGVGVELPIGDPDFLKKTYLKSRTANTAGATGIGLVGRDSTQETPEHPEMPPGQVATMLGFAEQAFARQHVDVGFTCSLNDLAAGARTFGLDQQIASGNYNGYKITLTGCQGKPAGSYQIVVEPLPGKAGKAYCTDATQNLRIADDGRGATCLSVGRAEARATTFDSEDGLPEPVTNISSRPKD